MVENGIINHALAHHFSSLPPRIKLSVVLDLEKENGFEINFREILKASQPREQICSDVYNSLSKLGTIFITTNYDEFLDKCSVKAISHNIDNPTSKPRGNNRRLFYTKEDISFENFDQKDAVFHIHGSVRDRDSMIMTTADYLERYASHRFGGAENYENPFLTFLIELFKRRNVLFVGYGLSELEILEYIIEKGNENSIQNGSENSTQAGEEPKHYVLQGFFTHQIDLVRALDGYFRRLGVGLIPYSRDDQNWDQLVEVLEAFSNEIQPNPPSALTRRSDMEKLLE